MSFQRWLDLERATVLHGLVRTRAELTVFEEWHLMFLVRTNAKILAEASALLNVAEIPESHPESSAFPQPVISSFGGSSLAAGFFGTSALSGVVVAGVSVAGDPQPPAPSLAFSGVLGCEKATQTHQLQQVGILPMQL